MLISIDHEEQLLLLLIIVISFYCAYSLSVCSSVGHIPTEGSCCCVVDEMSKENVNVSYLLGKEKDVRLRVFPETKGYFYYEVTIEELKGEYNDNSHFSLDIGVSNEKTNNSDESFCKFYNLHIEINT